MADGVTFQRDAASVTVRFVRSVVSWRATSRTVPWSATFRQTEREGGGVRAALVGQLCASRYGSLRAWKYALAGGEARPCDSEDFVGWCAHVFWKEHDEVVTKSMIVDVVRALGGAESGGESRPPTAVKAA